MMRIGIDSEWISVAELQRRASGPKVFLTPLITSPPSGPPGLSRRPGATNDVFPPQRDVNSFSGPFQSEPARSLRASTLDSFVNGGSNQPESPSSSFGTGRFGNGSPDLSAFGGRSGNNMFSTAEASLTSLGGARRSTYADSSLEASGGRSPFTSSVPARAPSFDMTFAGMFIASYSLIHCIIDIPDSPVDNVLGGPLSFGRPSLIRNSHDQNGDASSPFLSHENASSAEVGPSFTNGLQTYGVHSQGQPFSGSPSAQYTPYIVSSLGQPTSPLAPLVQQQTYAPSGTSQSPWGAQDPSGMKRPGPFDPSHPTSRNTAVVRQPSPWERNSQTPWITAQQESPSDSWVEGTSSLTFSNLEQHNQQQRHQPQDSVTSADDSTIPVTDVTGRPEPKLPQESTVDTRPVASESDAQFPSVLPVKVRQRSAQAKPQPAPSQQPPVSPVASTPPQPKAAWSMEEEAKKPKPSGVAVGFREIQEAETKRAEARKAIERERERAARAAASVSNEESSTFTASWGLPTSQVHSGRNSASKDSPSATSPNVATSATQPVWTSAPKPPVTKKTMKEIQEEEERRKKLEAMKEKETIGAAVRRAYAESTNKVCRMMASYILLSMLICVKSTPVQLVGPAWTTVGSSGKANSSGPPRPAAVTSIPASNNVGSPIAPRSTNGTVSSPRPTSVPKPVVAPPKGEDLHVNPSHDFLRWLGDSLKGLNASVNRESLCHSSVCKDELYFVQSKISPRCYCHFRWTLTPRPWRSSRI
jgi:PERQ amino acid-rich with GYF domain-containing protein